MRIFGLIGYPLTHSFSQKYFTEKFKKENILDTQYRNYPLKDIAEIKQLLRDEAALCGLNVTIPYKETVIPFLDALHKSASDVGAVNTIKIERKNGQEKITGYNTDVYGFRESLKPFLRSNHERALILGTGGAAKAVEHVLKQIGIDCFFVTRDKSKENTRKLLGYSELNAYTLQACHLIVNTSPVGMYPNIKDCPAIPYQFITPNHYLYDLVYNPEETSFLKQGKEKGALTQNGLSMLYMQAEKAWEIWNQEN